MANSQRKSNANFDPRRVKTSGTYTGEDGKSKASEIETPANAANDSTFDHVEDADDAKSTPGGRSPNEWKNHPSNPFVEAYAAQIKRWKSGDVVIDRDGNKVKRVAAEDADFVEEVKAERQRLANEILKHDGVFHTDLQGVADYLDADFENLRKPSASESEYSEYMKEEARLYDRVFGGKNLVGAEVYQEATEKIAKDISSEEDISDHYAMLRVRREAALQHFDDPRFIASVALYKGGKLKDELLVDFDRSDLNDGGVNESRTHAMAKVFGAEIDSSPGSDGHISEKVKTFQKLREQSQIMRGNQKAIMLFAEDYKGEGRKGKLELGLSALENVSYSDPVFNKWFKSFDNDRDAHNLKRSHLSIFDAAAARFEKEFNNNDPRAALSFAVMENSGRAINKSVKLSRLAAVEGNLVHGRAALNLFSDQWREENVVPAAGKFEDAVNREMGGNKLSGHKNGFAIIDDGKDGEKPWELDLSDAKSITVEDGGHLRIESMDGKASVLKLAGMDVPKVGVQTKSGNIDAGENSKRHLEAFFSRYGVENLNIGIIKNENGESVLRARLPSGEDLAQRMVKDGYAAPNGEVPGVIMREGMANQAQSLRRGLWAEGFVDMSDDWRSEKSGPALSDKDRGERMTDLIGKSTATTASHAYRLLSRPGTKLFGLPVEDWNNSPIIDEQIQSIANRQPARLETIYAQNMDVLREYRQRKDKLTSEEKHAHDRLSLGRRAMAKALINTGHMTEEQSRKDSHPLMSREGKRIDPKHLRAVGNAAAEIGAAGYQVGSAVAKNSGKVAINMLNTAME